MNHWKMVAAFGGAAVAFGLAFLYVHNQTLAPMIASGTGPNGVEVAPAGWLALLVTGLGTGGLSIATVVEAIKGIINALWPPMANGKQNPIASTLLAAVDVCELPILARAYNAIQDPVAKSKMWEVCKVAYDANFEKQFPKPPEIIAASSVLK